MPKFNEKKLVLASHNKGKLKEIKELLAPFDIDVFSAGDLGLPEPDETGSTFAENATLKALAAAKATNLPALADDSGLCVNALNGAPGIYSARWAGENKDFNFAMNRVNDELIAKGNTDRTAYFICVLALAFPNGNVETFEGRIYGNLVWPPHGEHGFGFDPMFKPDGYDDTFGIIPHEEKQKISHRANAFAKFIYECFSN